jgi:MinD-like ATPase involved in chromosome partitioning or flagellar assembly
MEGADRGEPIVVGDPQSAAARALFSLAEKVRAAVPSASGV